MLIMFLLTYAMFKFLFYNNEVSFSERLLSKLCEKGQESVSFTMTDSEFYQGLVTCRFGFIKQVLIH